MDAEIYLNRYETKKGRTFGFISFGYESFCDTLEKKSKIIPAGTYELVRRMSPSFGRRMWYLTDVPNRKCVMIHYGNTLDDTNGCILVGERDGLTLINSRFTLAILDAKLSVYDKVKLTIIE